MSKGRFVTVLSGVVVAALVLVPAAIVLIASREKPSVVSRTTGETRRITKDQGYVAIEESKFILKIPPDWSRDTTRTTGSLIVYKSGGTTDQARMLEIYSGAIPETFNSTRLLPVAHASGGIKTGQVSERCHNFTKPKEGFGGARVSPPLPSAWQGITFTCNFSSQLNIAATANSATGYRTEIKGPTSSGSYTFVYTDHSGNPDFSIFSSILQSFRHK